MLPSFLTDTSCCWNCPRGNIFVSKEADPQGNQTGETFNVYVHMCVRGISSGAIASAVPATTAAVRELGRESFLF